LGRKAPFVIYRRKKFSDITLQYKALLGIVFRDFPREILESLESLVDALAYPAGVGVCNELLVEEFMALY